MILVTITALLAVCSADKLDRTYLPPASAQSAGGSPGSLQAPFASKTFNQGLGGIPHGSFNNEYDGVVVDAPAAGTRSSEFVASGLGAPRPNYGSSHSKVGEAAFKEAPQQQPFGRFPGALNSNNQQNGDQGAFQNSNTRPDFTQSDNFQGSASAPQQPERPQAMADRSANTVKFESDVDTDKFNYAFETDNGITAEENGVDNNGIQAKGGFSYTGDDGQVYSVTYTADEGGYKPQGSHLPTPPPIPEEILKSLEKNAQDEAAGIIDDGSYDARKYNAGSEYTESENDSKYNGGTNVFGNRRESAVTSSGSFNQNTFARPAQNNIRPSSSSVVSGSGSLSQSNKISNGFRPSSDQNEQSGQLVGVSNENLSLNNNPSPSYRPQAPQYNNGAQFLSQKGQENVRDSESIGATGLFNSNQDKSKPVFGNYNGLNSPQNFGNRPPGFINAQPASNTVSTDSNKLQNPSRLSPNNEYLPPKNSFTSGANQPQSSFSDTSRFSSQNIQYSGTFASGPNQPSRQPLRQNSFQQSSVSVQGLGLTPTISKPISSTFMSQNVNNRFNYQQPTLKPDLGLTTPIDESFSFSSNSRQPSISSQYPRPTGQDPTYSMTSNIKNSEKPSIEFPKPVPSSASASASANLQATVPAFQQTISANRQSSSSYQSNQNKQVFGPSAITQNNHNIVSQNQASQSSINPNSQYQDNNDAYYYNQPGQSFNTPNQPSLPANQFNKFSQQTPSSEQNIQTNGFLNPGPSTTVTYPVPQTAAPTVPTSATQNNLGLNQVPQFSGITQATATSFVSHASSQSFANLPQTQQGSRLPAQSSKPEFGQTPTAAVPSFPQFNQQQNINQRPFISTQQQSGYTGEIYQYNKPPQVFPASDVKSEDEKSTSIEISQPTEGSPTPTGEVKPQFGSNPSFTQQSKGEIYDYKKPPQVSPASAETKKPEINAPSSGEVQAQSTAQPQFGQFSYQSVKPTNTNPQLSGNIGSDGSSIRPICCKQVPQTSNLPIGSSSSSATASVSSQSGPDAFDFQGTLNSNQAVGGRGEVFSESRKPPSYDPETGYHY